MRSLLRSLGVLKAQSGAMISKASALKGLEALKASRPNDVGALDNLITSISSAPYLELKQGSFVMKDERGKDMLIAKKDAKDNSDPIRSLNSKLLTEALRWKPTSTNQLKVSDKLDKLEKASLQLSMPKLEGVSSNYHRSPDVNTSDAYSTALDPSINIYYGPDGNSGNMKSLSSSEINDWLSKGFKFDDKGMIVEPKELDPLEHLDDEFKSSLEGLFKELKANKGTDAADFKSFILSGGRSKQRQQWLKLSGHKGVADDDKSLHVVDIEQGEKSHAADLSIPNAKWESLFKQYGGEEGFRSMMKKRGLMLKEHHGSFHVEKYQEPVERKVDKSSYQVQESGDVKLPMDKLFPNGLKSRYNKDDQTGRIPDILGTGEGRNYAIPLSDIWNMAGQDGTDKIYPSQSLALTKAIQQGEGKVKAKLTSPLFHKFNKGIGVTGFDGSGVVDTKGFKVINLLEGDEIKYRIAFNKTSIMFIDPKTDLPIPMEEIKKNKATYIEGAKALADHLSVPKNQAGGVLKFQKSGIVGLNTPFSDVDMNNVINTQNALKSIRRKAIPLTGLQSGNRFNGVAVPDNSMSGLSPRGPLNYDPNLAAMYRHEEFNKAGLQSNAEIGLIEKSIRSNARRANSLAGMELSKSAAINTPNPYANPRGIALTPPSVDPVTGDAIKEQGIKDFGYSMESEVPGLSKFASERGKGLVNSRFKPNLMSFTRPSETGLKDELQSDYSPKLGYKGFQSGFDGATRLREVPMNPLQLAIQSKTLMGKNPLETKDSTYQSTEPAWKKIASGMGQYAMPAALAAFNLANKSTAPQKPFRYLDAPVRPIEGMDPSIKRQAVASIGSMVRNVPNSTSARMNSLSKLGAMTQGMNSINQLNVQDASMYGQDKARYYNDLDKNRIGSTDMMNRNIDTINRNALLTAQDKVKRRAEAVGLLSKAHTDIKQQGYDKEYMNQAYNASRRQGKLDLYTADLVRQVNAGTLDKDKAQAMIEAKTEEINNQSYEYFNGIDKSAKTPLFNFYKRPRQ